MYPLDFYVVVVTKFFNTPGTEIAPGSDKVGKDFDY